MISHDLSYVPIQCSDRLQDRIVSSQWEQDRMPQNTGFCTHKIEY